MDWQERDQSRVAAAGAVRAGHLPKHVRVLLRQLLGDVIDGAANEADYRRWWAALSIADELPHLQELLDQYFRQLAVIEGRSAEAAGASVGETLSLIAVYLGSLYSLDRGHGAALPIPTTAPLPDSGSLPIPHPESFDGRRSW